MEAKDLRIGNLVYGAYDTVIKLTTSQLVNFSVGMEDIKPIPLTEQWLLDFGFKFSDQIMAYEIELQNENNLLIDTTNLYYYQIGYDVYWTNPHYIKYVHSLQNLYFALTGKDLTK